MEYLTRYPETLRIEPPYSILVDSEEGEQVVVYHLVEDPSLVCQKIWSLDKVVLGDKLPPHESCLISRDLFDEQGLYLLAGMTPIEYKWNLPSDPKLMDQAYYEFMLESILYSPQHGRCREKVVWRSFSRAFSERIAKVEEHAGERMRAPRRRFFMIDPLLSTHWEIWKTHMLLDFKNDVAPELAYWVSHRFPTVACAAFDHSQ